MFSCVAVITSTIGLGLGPTETNSIEWRSYFALGIVLFIMTLLINTVATIILSRIQRRFTGEKHKEKSTTFRESKLYNAIQKYNHLILTILISGLIILVFPDLMSKIIGVILCVGLSIIIYVHRIVPKNYKKYIKYGAVLLFVGWVLTTWIGILFTIIILALIIGTRILFKKISAVGQEKFWFIIFYMNLSIEHKRVEIQKTLDSRKTRGERNRLGQFATPTELAKDILKYAKTLISKKNKINFLDPAVGTGSFFSALVSTFSESEIEKAEGFEIDPHYADPSKGIWRDSILNIKISDFTKENPPEKKNQFNLIKFMALVLA